MPPDSASRSPSRLRRRSRAPRVVPADRWQRAVGWIVDVTPFLLISVAAILWIEGPTFVLGTLRGLLGLPGGTDLPSASAAVTPGTPENGHLGDLLLLVGVLVVITAAWIGYRVIATARYGQTVGKWLVGSRVVRVDDPSRPPTLRQSWVRFLVPQTSGWLPVPGSGLVPYLTLVLHPRRRGLHDKAAGTIVVKTEPDQAQPDQAQPVQAEPVQATGENS